MVPPSTSPAAWRTSPSRARSTSPTPPTNWPKATYRRGRWAARVARGLSPFVGRTGEAESLRGALERARSGEGNLVAVVGGPGIGKSRLIRRFLESEVFAN